MPEKQDGVIASPFLAKIWELVVARRQHTFWLSGRVVPISGGGFGQWVRSRHRPSAPSHALSTSARPQCPEKTQRQRNQNERRRPSDYVVSPRIHIAAHQFFLIDQEEHEDQHERQDNSVYDLRQDGNPH